MFIKNNDIDIMIKVENMIGMNEKHIFGKDKNKTIDMGDYTITYTDFINFINLIERIQQNQKKVSAKSNAYNKANKEYHRITSNMHQAKKSGNQERYNYWKAKLEEYKRNK